MIPEDVLAKCRALAQDIIEAAEDFGEELSAAGNVMDLTDYIDSAKTDADEILKLLDPYAE